jgi:hypothetical protein
VKYFFLALILTIVQPLPPLPRQTVDKQAENTTAKSQVSDQRQNPADPSSSIIAINNCKNEDTRANAANNEAPNLHPDAQKQPEPWSRSEILTLVYDILTGILVVIALGTGLAVAWQAVKTAEATRSMRDSIRVQEAGLKQWVDIGEWKAIADAFVDYAVSSQREVIRRPSTISTSIRFKIFNNTPRPLSVTSVKTKLQVAGREDWQEFISSETHLVAPNGDYPSFVRITLAGDEVDRYILDNLMISIIIEVSYIDSLTQKCQQSFTNLATCGCGGQINDGLHSHEFLGAGPEQERP